ncbi:hypothetical protein BaRGS_00006442 [Batillaria attramentaria]|uniref:Uncharacterized protein n=1 Tax=Batillaria attramentaria TaxID=370345 RepID=A0ABD0LSC6_9CAEN
MERIGDTECNVVIMERIGDTECNDQCTCSLQCRQNNLHHFNVVTMERIGDTECNVVTMERIGDTECNVVTMERIGDSECNVVIMERIGDTECNDRVTTLMGPVSVATSLWTEIDVEYFRLLSQFTETDEVSLMRGRFPNHGQLRSLLDSKLQ